jgi:3-oxoadipate CoA-transferase alpha subunit
LDSKIFETMDQAVADVPDGATIMFPGFGRTGYPRNLIAALIRHGAKDLTGISNRPGNPGAVMDVGHLIEAGRMKKMICAFTASPYPSRKSSLEIKEEAGEITSELVPQGTFVERIRAAGAGIGGFYTVTGVGTEIAEGKEHRSIDGRDHILEFPLPADYAFIRAYRADSTGNLQFRLTQRNFNPIMAMAARTTIVEVEQEIAEPGALDPDSVHTPGIVVDRIVQIPPAPEGIWDATTDD